MYKAIDLRHVIYDNNLWNTECDGERLYVKTTDIYPIVALKRIYVTSAPNRILSELKMLNMFDHKNVISLVTALREEDQVIAVYFFHDQI